MDETWSTLTANNVLAEFTPVEKSTLNGVQGVTTALAGIVTGVSGQVRKAYMDGGRPTDADVTTIPASEFERAIAIARWKWLNSFPALKSMQTDARKKAAEDAEDYFARIATREFKGSGGAEIVSSQTRRLTRQNLDGI